MQFCPCMSPEVPVRLNDPSDVEFDALVTFLERYLQHLYVTATHCDHTWVHTVRHLFSLCLRDFPRCASLQCQCVIDAVKLWDLDSTGSTDAQDLHKSLQAFFWVHVKRIQETLWQACFDPDSVLQKLQHSNVANMGRQQGLYKDANRWLLKVVEQYLLSGRQRPCLFCYVCIISVEWFRRILINRENGHSQGVAY